VGRTEFEEYRERGESSGNAMEDGGNKSEGTAEGNAGGNMEG
jgi:hypothetical protein